MSFLRGSVLFVAAMFAQWWWNAHLAYWGAAPQFLLTFTVLIAARRGPVAAMLFGYVWGLYSDTLRADLFGASALLYAAAGYVSGMLRRQIDLSAPEPLAATVFILSLAYTVLFGALGHIFIGSFAWVGWTSALISPFLNALVALIAAAMWDTRGLS
jgi:rod shape-determining protein MreD